MNMIKVRPRKWWYWITRFRQIKTAERIINYWYKEEGEKEEKRERKAVLELIILGNTFIDKDLEEVKNERN